MKLGSIFKGIGNALAGAVGGFLSTGSPLGAIVGGIGGLFGGRKGSTANDHIGAYIPPTSQEAYNIIKGLEGQVPSIAYTQFAIQKPFIDEAYSIFKSAPSTYGQLFTNVEGSIKERYSDLFNTIKSQLENQWNKSALGLSALGLYNTGASQLTQADLLDQIYSKIAEAQTKELVNLDEAKLNAYLNYYDQAPKILTSFSDIYAKLNPEVSKFELQLDLAKVLNGLSANTVIYPKSTPLQQVSGMLNNYLLNSAIHLPDFGDLFGGIKKLFS